VAVVEADDRLKIYHRAQFLVISIRESITYGEIEPLKEKIIDQMEAADGYILELKEIEHIDSTGLGLLVTIAKHLVPNDNRMVIVNQNEQINELFSLSKLDLVFSVFNKMDEAEEDLIQTNHKDYITRLKGY